MCFSSAVADYLVFDEVKSSPNLQDIPDVEVQQNLDKVRLLSNCIRISHKLYFIFL